MSKFYEKIVKGEVPTEDDWNAHLIESHADAPSMTPHAFAAFKSIEGQNSYEILAQKLKSRLDTRILDLGCGDGHLIQYVLPSLQKHATLTGVDMSEAELNIAKSKNKDPRISFSLGTAQHLPCENASVDHVLCHMVFMLITPLDPVISELKRILKKGGAFSAVIGNTKNATPTVWHEIMNSVYNPIFVEYPKLKEATFGDARVNSEAGLQSIFNPGSGFSSPTIYDFSIIAPMKPDTAWAVMKDMYFVSMLPNDKKQKVEKDLRKLVSALSASHKTFEFPMRLFSTSKL